MTKRTDAKKGRALAEHGALNPRPRKVAHQLFRFNEFFDPYDGNAHRILSQKCIEN